MNARTRLSSLIDVALRPDIPVEVECAGGPDRGHAGRQIQPRQTPLRRPRAAPLHLVEEVVVHSHQTRDDGAPWKSESLGFWRNLDDGGRSDGRDAPVPENDGLVSSYRPSGAIDDAHMRQREHRVSGQNRFIVVTAARDH
jgi:hypothetical protein